MKILRVFLLLAGPISILFAGCGGGPSANNTTPPSPSQFSIGGSVSGLAGTGLVLQDNGGDNLSVTASGNFTFKTSVTSGGAYKVTVLTEPSTPAQTCVVTNASGTATANVTNVQVVCTTVTHTIAGTVINLAGANGGLQLDDNGNDLLSVNANGAFTFATPIDDGSTYAVTISMQPTNPAQTCGVTNGTGTATANVTNVTVDCGHNEWTWMGGSDLVNQAGIYGTMGTPAAANFPGGRGGPPNSWVDRSGNFWLFGGDGPASTVTGLNDLWKYSNGEWTWVAGSDMSAQAGMYGTMGVPSPTNVAGGRCCAGFWTDSSGNFWFFGGQGNDSAGTFGDLNDLWKYSNGEWTWVAGSNVANQKGIYGTLGAPSASNIPGARDSSVAWADSSGNFWLFGGQGYDSAGTFGVLNDLWKYSNGEWTWVAGSNVANQKGIYGTLGTPSAANNPGARGGAAHWTDPSGNVWLFGGFGFDSASTSGQLNDLWKYSNGQWVWVGGSNVTNQLGEYGTQGTPSSNNIPGARYGATAWTDTSGNFWLFGGNGYDAVGHFDLLSDLWKYGNGQWTWMSGADLVDRVGSYGTLGTPNPSNIPGARRNFAGWIDAQGNLRLYGGHGYDSAATVGQLSDLWMYKP